MSTAEPHTLHTPLVTTEAASQAGSSGPMADTALTMGIDLGTSAVKVVVMDSHGAVRATGLAGFATHCETAGQAEQEPADWLQALSSACAQLASQFPGRAESWISRVVGIGVTGQLPTLVCLGDSGAIGRAITWKDSRADEATAARIDAGRRRALYQRTGMPIDGRYLGPMFLHHFGAAPARASVLLSAKDFIVHALTGARITDPSTAAGYGAFDLGSRSFDADLCEQWQIRPSLLPAIAASHAMAGPLNAEGAQLLGLPAGVPVNVGAADSVSSAHAMGGLAEGIGCITLGSSTVILDAVREVRLDPFLRYLLTPHVQPGWYGREMDLLATGTGHQWLSRLLGFAEGELDRRAAQSVPGARGLVFSPYLAGGEQGALWDPSLRGALSGLGLHHEPCDLARAFLEGVGFEIRRCLDVLAENGAVRQIVLSGPLTAHRSSLQLLADILHRPIIVESSGSTAACGAALLAWQMVGVAVDPQARQGRNPVDPGPDSGRYEALYARYLRRTAAQREADADPVV